MYIVRTQSFKCLLLRVYSLNLYKKKLNVLVCISPNNYLSLKKLQSVLITVSMSHSSQNHQNIKLGFVEMTGESLVACLLQIRQVMVCMIFSPNTKCKFSTSLFWLSYHTGSNVPIIKNTKGN